MERAIQENLIFVCVECGKERMGSEIKTCEHLYKNYCIKGGDRWKEKFGEEVSIDDF